MSDFHGENQSSGSKYKKFRYNKMARQVNDIGENLSPSEHQDLMSSFNQDHSENNNFRNAYFDTFNPHQMYRY